MIGPGRPRGNSDRPGLFSCAALERLPPGSGAAWGRLGVPEPPTPCEGLRACESALEREGCGGKTSRRVPAIASGEWRQARIARRLVARISYQGREKSPWGAFQRQKREALLELCERVWRN